MNRQELLQKHNEAIDNAILHARAINGPESLEVNYFTISTTDRTDIVIFTSAEAFPYLHTPPNTPWLVATHPTRKDISRLPGRFWRQSEVPPTPFFVYKWCVNSAKWIPCPGSYNEDTRQSFVDIEDDAGIDQVVCSTVVAQFVAGEEQQGRGQPGEDQPGEEQQGRGQPEWPPETRLDNRGRELRRYGLGTSTNLLELYRYR